MSLGHLKSAFRAIGLFVIAGCAHAQFTLSNFRWDVQPTPGGYYDPTQPGTGVMVDTLPQGTGSPFVFIAYYHYDSVGRSDWLTMGTTVTQSSLSEYTASGVPAAIRSQWIRSTGGQCLDCAYTAPVTGLVPGDRVLSLISSRQIGFPAAGNAAAQTMKLAKDFGATGVISRSLLDSGIVWAARARSSFNGAESVFDAGWIRFRPRTERLSQLTTYTPGNAVTAVPAFLTSLSIAQHNAGPQWEAQCIREGGNAGTCGSSDLMDAGTATMSDTNNVSLTIDATSDRVRYTVRCINSPCIPLDPAHAVDVGELIELAPTADGRRRLALRIFSAGLGGWRREVELTQVGADYLAATFPNGVPQ